MCHYGHDDLICIRIQVIQSSTSGSPNSLYMAATHFYSAFIGMLKNSMKNLNNRIAFKHLRSERFFVSAPHIPVTPTKDFHWKAFTIHYLDAHSYIITLCNIEASQSRGYPYSYPFMPYPMPMWRKVSRYIWATPWRPTWRAVRRPTLEWVNALSSFSYRL